MRDLESLEDCQALVDAFYTAVRADRLLGPVFEARVQHWPAHLARMADFWATILLAAARYHGQPLAAHRGLELSPAHFTRWLGWWDACVDARFAGPRAEHAKRAARKMALRLAHANDAPGGARDAAPSRAAS